MTKQLLRNIWKPYVQLNWRFGIVLILLVCVPRFILVLGANQSGSYGFIGLVMVLSALIPFVFLNRQGRQQMGLKRPKNVLVLLYALLAGIVFSVVLHYLGVVLYEQSYENWYVYFARSYQIPEELSAQGRRMMFMMMAITGMTFSPIGEEFYFRGIVHESFSSSLGERKASVVDSLAFAITHLSHFGWVFVNDQWQFYTIPALIWMSAMFGVSLLFYRMRQQANSIWGAVVCHAGFNLGMIYCIFYLY